MPTRRQTLRRAQEVIDELDDSITSEQRRLLCMALQLEYDEDYTEDDAFLDESSEPGLWSSRTFPREHGIRGHDVGSPPDFFCSGEN